MTNKSVGELDVCVYMVETSGQGGVNLAEILQKQEEKQKIIEEKNLLI